ncbi:ATP-binding protein [Actinomadura parmotrematis]|uniref:ATP-binding protein n=1 Tax=Actinomadura parmotrematis TaxID=2864039 RepID=A0ABS7FZF0_9ACTN|nr:ATP-binding protein [Actinomadura parmotrematis]MBW8485825.1 ATP-binding protein [Actinomadura parmotrematis]
MHSTPVPESSDLPPRLACALDSLVDPVGPAATFTVPPDPESVTDARHFALDRLGEWRLGALRDDVGLVVSELVTNALRHSGGTPLGMPRWNARDGFGALIDPLGSAPAVIQLRLVHEASWLLCGIIDASGDAPRRKEPDYIAETGRGLHLVESFSRRWGWRGLPRGKVVWALFRDPTAGDR